MTDVFEKMTLSSEEVIAGLTVREEIPAYTVVAPTEEYGFLHEGAIIAFHGVLFTAWYNCTKTELEGVTPIRFSKSSDGGMTWSEPKLVTKELDRGILYCPPVFGICDGRLYMLLNEMVSADHMHALDLYRYEEDTEEFVMLWSRPIPFKLNTNVVTLANGKLMLPGRIAEPDGFPNTPAVMISDSGKIDAEWRLVYLQKNGDLPDGSRFVHPEISAVVDGAKVYMFARNDERDVPLLYVSEDHGETWSKPIAHDIPFSSSKIYAGTLADGRNYVIGNLLPDRSRLAVFFSAPGTMRFTEGFFLRDGFSETLGYGVVWHYPCAWEADGKLYVAYTAGYDTSWVRRGLTVSVIDLADFFDKVMCRIV